MNAELFLKALDGPAPSGAELRNEPAFQLLERMMESGSREARTDEAGNISLVADVDWHEIISVAGELAETGRDLRLLVIVARAWTNTDGFAGLAAGLGMIRQSLDDYWDSIHPELRDRQDPGEASLRRKNAIMQIDNDDNGLLGDLKMMVVLNPRGIGPIRTEDLAQGGLSEFDFMTGAPSGLGEKEKAALKERHAKTVSRVTAACRALNAETPDRARELAEALAAANESRQALEKCFAEKAGLSNGFGVRLAELGLLLERARTTIENAIGEGGDLGNAEDAVMPESKPAAAPAATSASPAPSVVGTAVPTGVNSRRDVERCLDMIIDFYERTEPSSPIPHLVRRIRRMVPMDFIELMEEIAPSGMKEFKSVAGVDEKKGKSE